MKKLIYVLVVPAVLISCLAFATFKKETIINAVSAKPNDEAPFPYSVIGGTEKLGPNILVLIDKKEVPKDILFKISGSCIRGSAVFRPDFAFKKYGARAKDGSVEITTKNGKLTYLTDIEKENIIKEHNNPPSQFYTRLHLKNNDGTFYDKIIMHVLPGGTVNTDIAVNAKAGFYIDKTFYDEEGIKKVPAEIIAVLSGAYGVRSGNPAAAREKGYEKIFEFNTLIKKTSAIPVPATGSDTAKKYSIIKGLDKMGPNPLVLIDDKEYPSTILYQISSSCVKGGATYLPENAIKKFGNKAKDGCVVLKTRNGEIAYMNRAEQDGLAMLAQVPANQFFSRTSITDRKGNRVDRIAVHLHTGCAAGTDVSPKGKVAFIIDSVFYSEDAVKNFTPDKIAAIDGRLGFGVKDLAAKDYPGVDLHGYEAIFHFQTKGPAMLMTKEALQYHWEKFLPAN